MYQIYSISLLDACYKILQNLFVSFKTLYELFYTYEMVFKNKGQEYPSMCNDCKAPRALYYGP